MPNKKWIPNKKQFEDVYEAYAREGYNAALFARMLGISHNTWNNWKDDFKKYFVKQDKVRNRRHGSPGHKRGFRKLTPEIRKRILDLAEQGMTQKKIAEFCGVSVVSIIGWRKKDKTFERQYKYAMEIADYDVQRSIRKRATGMRAKDVTTVVFLDASGRVINRTTTTRKRDVLPNVEAGKFWMINRQNWSRDSEKVRSNNQGLILDTIENMVNGEEPKEDREEDNGNE